MDLMDTLILHAGKKSNMIFLRLFQNFLQEGELPKSWSSTKLPPIPKVDNPSSFKQFRPIRLCNFCIKVISKILVERFSRIVPNIILAEQSGFVKGRTINDNILLADEHIQSIKNKV